MSRVLVRYNVQMPFHEETITLEQHGGKGAHGITTAFFLFSLLGMLGHICEDM